MSGREELSSTDKLLHLIRSSDAPNGGGSGTSSTTASGRDSNSAPVSPPITHPSPAPSPAPTSAPASASPRHSASSAWSTLRSRLTGWSPSRRGGLKAGVFLRPESVAVAVSSGEPGGERLLDHFILPVHQEEPAAETAAKPDWLQAPALKNTLRKALQRVGSRHGAGRFEVWTAIPWQDLDIHLLTVPKAAPAEMNGAVAWAARKNIDGFEPGKQVLDFVLRPDPADNNRWRAVIFLAGRERVAELRKLFLAVSCPLGGIAAPAVAVGHLCRRLNREGGGSIFSHLQLESDHSLISLLRDGALEFSRDIKTGTNSIIEAPVASPAGSEAPPVPTAPPRQEARRPEPPAIAGAEERTEPEMVLSLEEEPPSLVLTLENDGEDGTAVEEPVAEGGAVDPEPEVAPVADIPPDEPGFDHRALTRLVRQLDRTFDYSRTNLDIPRPNHIFLSGSSRMPAALLANIEEEAGIPCSWLDPFAALAASGQAPEPPADIRERQLLALPAGLSCCGRDSQNFLLTHQDRIRQDLAHKANQLIIGVFIILALGLALVYGWQQGQLKELRGELATARQQRLALTADQHDEAALAALAAEISRTRAAIAEQAERRRVPAVLSEIQELLPAGAALTEISITAAGAGEAAERGERVALAGVAKGSAAERDLVLARLLRRLERSGSVAGEVKIIGREERMTAAEEQVLLFRLEFAVKPSTAGGRQAAGSGGAK